MAEVTTEELATLQREFDWLLSQEVPKVAFESVNYQFLYSHPSIGYGIKQPRTEQY